jgi:hypothetical protein
MHSVDEPAWDRPLRFLLDKPASSLTLEVLSAYKFEVVDVPPRSTFYPDLRRLFMSGYTAEVISYQGVLKRAWISSRSLFRCRPWRLRCARCWIGTA